MNESQMQNAGAVLIRISLGIVLLAHSAYLKIMVFGVAGTVGFFESIGLHAAIAYLTIATEIATGIAFIAGYQVRLAALACIPVLLGATWAHSGNGWLFSNANGGWEYPLILVVMAVVVALFGNGKEDSRDVVAAMLRSVSSPT